MCLFPHLLRMHFPLSQAHTCGAHSFYTAVWLRTEMSTFVLCDHWRELHLTASPLPRDNFNNTKPFHIKFWEVACKVGLWGLKGWKALLSIKDLLTKNLLAINRLINLFVNVSWIPVESSKAMIPVQKPTEHSVIFKPVICNSSFFSQLSMLRILQQWPRPCPVCLNHLPMLFFTTSRDLAELWKSLLWTKQNKQTLTSKCWFLLPIKPSESTEDSILETHCS